MGLSTTPKGVALANRMLSQWANKQRNRKMTVPEVSKVWVDLADFMEAEQREIDIDRTAAIAERELEHLIEVGAYNQVRAICERIAKVLPK